jgi:hypothetical protein
VIHNLRNAGRWRGRDNEGQAAEQQAYKMEAGGGEATKEAVEPVAAVPLHLRL